MSTRSTAKNLFLPLDNPELAIRRKSRSDLILLNNSETAAEGHGDLPVLDLRTMKELCQPSLNGRGGPIAPISIQATNFGLKNDMIQQVQNSCQFHGLPSDDANKHLDIFLQVSQSIKVNGVTNDALRLYLFPHFLTHHATACESSSSITSSFDTEIAALKAEMTEINKNLMRVLQPLLAILKTYMLQVPIKEITREETNYVPLILGRSFHKTERALIDVFKGKLTFRVSKEAMTFNLDQTSRYSANYNDMMVNRIDVIDMACEEYSQEVLGFFDLITSGNLTSYYDAIVSTTSPTSTPFGNSNFLLEEVDAFLALEDDPTSLEVDQSYLDSEGDILLLEAFLNDDPSLPPPNQGNYLPEVHKELKICEAKSDKSLIHEPPEVELKDLPPWYLSKYTYF
nr:reverse transcriptase domain-containing protein [Tanacetum cinerariifolium]